MPARSEAQVVKNPLLLTLAHEKVSSLRYGVAQIVVHDGGVNQRETTGKVRFDRRDSRADYEQTRFRGGPANRANRETERVLFARTQSGS